MASFTVLTNSFTLAKKQAEVDKRIRSIKHNQNRIAIRESKSATNSPILQRRNVVAATSSPNLQRQQISNATDLKNKSYHKKHSSSSHLHLPTYSPSSPRQRTRTLNTAEDTINHFQTDSEVFMMYRSCSRYNAPRRSLSAPTLTPSTSPLS